MSNEIIVDESRGQTRVAILEDKELVELYIEGPEHTGMVGNIYRGLVESVLPGMEAAFVKIGEAKNAFLYVDDITLPGKTIDIDEPEKEVAAEKLVHMDINEILKVGQIIDVQVTKEPFGTKGARVTTNITLPGRYLVLLPTVDYIAVSKRITNEPERQRLKAILQAIKPKGMGVIVRTEGEGKDQNDFTHDLNFLVKLWERIARKKETSNVPTIIHRDFNLLFRVVRDMFTLHIDRFVVNSSSKYAKVLELVDMISPSLKQRVEYFSKDINIFEHYQIENKIIKALDRKVWLKSGGYLVIDHTEALTAIDVNTGKYVGETDLEDTARRTNLEAAKEIAKQLRLRDIGGIIIIDFVHMTEQLHWDSAIECLKHYVRKDKTKTTVVGMTNLGLVEMTRKKVREQLSTVLEQKCRYCRGKSRVYVPEMLIRTIEKEIIKNSNEALTKTITIQMHPEAEEIFRQENEHNIEMLESKIGRKIIIHPNENFSRDEFLIEDVDKTESMC